MMRKLTTWLILASGLAAVICPNTPATAQSAAMNYTKAYRYDSGGRLLGTISPPPVVGTSANFIATRNTYDGQGRLSMVESGVLSSWQSDTVAPASWGAAFTVKKTVNYSYDGYGNKSQETVTGSDGAVAAVTQYSYDAYDRPICTAVRMDSTQWPTQTDPCAPQTTAAAGPDRVSKMVYDSLGRVIQQWEGVGTSVAAAVATQSWTASSKLQYMIDANGNRAQMVYDGYDRLQCWIFPSKTGPSSYNPSSQSTALSTAGAVSGDCVSGGDYEKYGYDNNGNRTSLRKRDGTTISYSYDALNRDTSKIVPTSATGAAGYTVNLTYDLLGHQLTATFASSGLGITNAYNGFGELTSASSNLDGTARTLSYQYDSDSDRTRITHPDTVYFTTSYDGLDRPSIASWTTTGGTTQFVAFNYDSIGRRSSINRASSWTFYGYDGIDRLTSECQRFAGGTCGVTQANTLNQTLAYNPASDITSDARDNTDYSWTGAVNANRGYTPNGLNQYASVGGTTFAYDVNGNLTTDGANSFIYDDENRLTSVTGAHTATLSYDPLGRLWQVSSPSGTTRFLYDSDHLAAEYDGSGNMLHRYYFGPNSDEPILDDTGAALSCSGTHVLHQDHEGSVIALADCWGNRTAVNSYDEYGIPGSSNTGRFQYTGQAWLSEIGMYYYKARIYSPTLGRFLQTDPIGYEGGINLYAYVGDDPMDRTDPSGHGDPNNEQNCPQTTIDPGAGPCVHGNQDNGPDTGPQAGVPTSNEERADLAARNPDAYWASRAKRGDPLGQEGVDFSLSKHGSSSLETAKSNLMDQLRLKHGGYQVFAEVMGGDRAAAVREYNQIRLELAVANMKAVDADWRGIPHLLSPYQIANYHWAVFAAHGVPAIRFGGSMFTGTRFDIWLYGRLWCGACDR